MNQRPSRYVSLLMGPLWLASCSDDVQEAPVGSGGSSAGGAPVMAGNATSGGAAPAGGGGFAGGARGGVAGVGGGGGPTQAGAGSGARAGNAGAAGSASGGGAAGSTGAAGSAGMGGTSGGGAAGGTSGVGAGSAGMGGTSGGGTAGGTSGAGAGSAGMGGASGAGLLSIAADFNPFRIECPCKDANHFGLDKQDNCDSLPEVDRQTHVKHLAGDPNVVYNVKIHVRGLTEPNTYVGGELLGDRFYTGGETSAAGYTSYMLTVSEPEEVYFFNYNPVTGHLHFALDYEVVIPMKGGATVTFEVNGGKSVPDGHGVSNRDRLVVPGVPPAPEPFNGQFVQFDVVTVEPRPNP
jgi:hypothetical protein